MTRCVYLLSNHPEVAVRVRAELDRTLGERNAKFEDLEQLPLLRAVVKETLRLFPAAPVFAREVSAPFKLGETALERGDRVLFSPYAMHRDPLYFPEPDRFRPDRFLDGSTDRLPKLAYLPFGAGPRVCIGQHFATMEAELLLATLLQHVELEVPADFRLELVPVITIRSRYGLPVRVRRRARAAQPAIQLDQPQL